MVELLPHHTVTRLPVWLNGNTLVSFNVVTLHPARLVPGWMTIFGWVNHVGAELVTQVWSTQPLWVVWIEYPV